MLCGYRPRVVTGAEGLVSEPTPSAVVVAEDDVIQTMQRAGAVHADGKLRGVSLVWMVRPEDLDHLRAFGHLVDDFLTLPWEPAELETRLRLLDRRNEADEAEVLRRGPLTMNLATYQVTLGEHPLDLTFMEYELLKLLMTHPGRVFRREEILSRVWGYDYYGGMRTVDVHVRRLRAKLGNDHAWLVETVRSVGYRLARTHR
ncbi:MAG TPA: response regulator transcription factor [Actinomycetota bacterium]